ncbi:MAG TPA: hypothetical protein VGS58_07680, partial [Candidatus Sulfopaludibacter sp.]|nr:hypothetical protein [Candidatus Sulfopaludibacter sp.]
MDTLRLSLLAVFCLGPSLAVSPVTIPLAFEHRDPGLFVAYSGGNSLHFQADRVTIGDVTLRFEHARPGARLEGIGPAAPANYIDATSRRTFPQFPRLAARGLYRGIDAVFYGSAG